MGNKPGTKLGKHAVQERLALFIHYYLLGGRNATEAYRKVFNPNPELTEAEVRARANIYLTKPIVQNALTAELEKLNNKLDVQKEQVITELIELYTTNKNGNIQEKEFALKSLKLYIDIMGLKAPTINHNYNVDVTPLTINFNTAQDVSIDENKPQLPPNQ